jgi:hypothetical protein
LLLDVAPDPVTPVIGIGGLILIAVIVLMLAAAAIVGFVFLLKRVMRRQPKTEVALREGEPVTQFQASSPNQP